MLLIFIFSLLIAGDASSPVNKVMVAKFALFDKFNCSLVYSLLMKLACFLMLGGGYRLSIIFCTEVLAMSTKYIVC